MTHRWIPFGNLQIHVVRAGTLRLDGGSMFGVVPRVLWERLTPPDERNRILLGTNILLVRGPHGTALVDTGCGLEWDARGRDMFAVLTHEGGAAGAVEAQAGVSPQAIDLLIQTHFHFDHAGGSTQAGPDGKPVPAFPRARVVVQRSNWDEANHPTELNQASYRPQDFMPLHDAGLLEFLDGEVEVVPGLRVRPTGGHATGHQIILLESGDAGAVYLGDIIPTWNHVKPAYVMGYDLYPMETLRQKKAIMDMAIANGFVGVSEHDPVHPFARFHRDAKGRYEAERLTEEDLPWRTP